VANVPSRAGIAIFRGSAVTLRSAPSATEEGIDGALFFLFARNTSSTHPASGVLPMGSDRKRGAILLFADIRPC